MLSKRNKLATSYWWDAARRFRRNRIAVLGACFILLVGGSAAIGPVVTHYSPLAISMKDRLEPPSAAHWFGTDDFGRDVLSRVLHGARISLMVSFSSVAFSLVLGTLLGTLGGYYGRFVDEVIMRFMDILFAFPAVLLAISIIAVLGPGTQNAIIAIGIVYTPIFARIARGSVLSVRGLDYVQAARALGDSEARIIFHHVLPNSLAPIIVETTLSLGFAILSEAALSFLGLGTQPPYPSLGRMLSEGRMFISESPWLGFFPGLAILLSVMGFNLLGDGMRDALDPKLKRLIR